MSGLRAQMSWPPLLVVWAMFTVNPVTISVYPRFSLPPATFRITVLVLRHKDSRRVCFGIDGPELKRSCEDLAGLEARRVWTVYWDLRTPGEYQASAIVTRMEDGRERTYLSQQPFKVLGFEP